MYFHQVPIAIKGRGLSSVSLRALFQEFLSWNLLISTGRGFLLNPWEQLQKEQTEKVHDSPNHIYGQWNMQNPAGMSGRWSAAQLKVLVIEFGEVQEA